MSFDETYFDDTSRVRLHCDGPDCWVEIRGKPPCPGPGRAAPRLIWNSCCSLGMLHSDLWADRCCCMCSTCS